MTAPQQTTTHHGRRRPRRRVARAVVVVAALVVGGVSLAGVDAPQPVAAATPSHPTLVNAMPTGTTPHATNGDVRAVAVVGDTVIMGGSFTAAADPDRTPVNRRYLLAFDKATGRILRDWAPQVDNEVMAIVAAPDGQSVYIGGRFNSVDGVQQFKVARLSVADGRPLPFQSGVNALVTDMALAGGRLYIGGVFSTVQGRATRFAALDAQTGALVPSVTTTIAGTHRGGEGRIWTIEPSPSGDSLLVAGNFATVDGQPRNQIAKLNIGANGAVTLSPWSTTAFTGFCASFTDYVRDVAYSPDGSRFTIVTTGAKGSGINGQCDAVSRWATTDAPGNATPVWTQYSGGDSYYSVEDTGAALYVGGHFRWSNNSFGSDSLGAGGIPTEGIASLDPANGLPLSWNPGRDRGRAVWQMVATPDGLYVASDTDRIARHLYRGRIAFFPLAGGLPVPQPERATLPVQLDQFAPASGGTPARVTTRGYDGSTLGAPAPAVANASALAGTRAAFVIGDVLYTAHGDGRLRARSYDGTTLGQPVEVDLLRLTAFANDLSNMTGAVYDGGRLYYTVNGSNTLFMRYFSTESRVIGAQRFDAASSGGGVSYNQVGGMVLAGDHVYFVNRQNGTLQRATWQAGGGIQPGTATTVSNANANGLSWTSTVLFARQGDVPNQPPSAEAAVECTGLRCSFDASASSDPDGSVVGVAWNLGDGTTASGETVEHTFAAPGTYEVAVTVTDDEGATGLASLTVTVEDAAPVASFEVTCEGEVCSVDGSGSSDPDGSIEAWAWDFGDGGTASGPTAVHTYTEPGDRTITLTVTDDRGLTASTTRDVTVTVPEQPGGEASFVGLSAADGQPSWQVHQVAVPADVQAGDQLLLFASSNLPGSADIPAPEGWEVLAENASPGMRNSVFARTATADDAGRTITVRLDTWARLDLALAAYRGLEAAGSPPAFLAGYTTPTVDVPLGAWAVSYWADKSATTTGFQTSGVTERRDFAGTGAGHMATVVADSDGPLAAGPYGGLTAVVAQPVNNAVGLTVVLVPTS